MIGFNHAPELLILLVIAFLVFGPEKLPEIARGAGRGIREFRKMSTELQQSISTTFQEPLQEVQQIQQELQQQVHDITRVTQESLEQSWQAPASAPAPAYAPINPVATAAQHDSANVAPVADVPETHAPAVPPAELPETHIPPTPQAPAPAPATPPAPLAAPALLSGAGTRLTLEGSGGATGGQTATPPEHAAQTTS